MSDHDTDPNNNVVEVKVIASSVVTLLAGIVVALLNAVQADSTILGALPPWLQFVILAVIPPILAFAVGYSKTSNRA